MSIKLNGGLKIGVLPTIASYIFLKAIFHFIKTYPCVKLIVFELKREEIISQLYSGSIDCGILSSLEQDSSFLEISLFSENFIVYLSENSKHRNKQTVNIEINKH